MIPQRRLRKRGVATASAPLAAAIALCLVASGHAATIAVNSASAGSDPGKCSLYDAVLAVNTAAAVSACAAGNGTANNPDTIDLSSFNLPTTITFSVASPGDNKSALALTKRATIKGRLASDGTPLVTLTRSAVSMRLLSASDNVTLQGIKFTGGSPRGRGGAVYASGSANLTLTNCVVSYNATQNNYSGGGVDVEHGALTINASTISNNTTTHSGGGVYATFNGAVTLNQSTISGNNAGQKGGGAASFGGSIEANASTFSGNSAATGGGIYANQNVKLTNTSGGGVYVRQHANLYFSTIAGNTNYGGGGGGLVLNGSGNNYLNAMATIIAKNASNDLENGDYGVCSGAFNIIGSGNGACQPPNSRVCDPNFGLLADNGGPTMTLSIPSTSCAVDNGPPKPLLNVQTDQRGAHFLRLFGTNTDIGAFEYQTDQRIFYDGFEVGT